MPIVTAMVFNAEALDTLLGAFDAEWHFADGMNLYNRCGSNPVNRRDPRGLSFSMPSQLVTLGNGTLLDSASLAGMSFAAAFITHFIGSQLADGWGVLGGYTAEGFDMFLEGTEAMMAGQYALSEALMAAARLTTPLVAAASIYSGDRNKYKPDVTVEEVVAAIAGLAGLKNLGLKKGGPDGPDEKPPGWDEILKKTWKEIQRLNKEGWKWAKQVHKVLKRGRI